MSAPQLDEPIDGRTARAVRTRNAIVDACLALIDEGDLRPTGPRIAERAEVSVRSIFQHFEELDVLFVAVGDRLTERLVGMVRPIDPGAALEDRVEALLDERAKVLETTTPVLNAALVHAASSKVIKRQFQDGQSFFRDQVCRVFATELAGTETPVPLTVALVVSMSWTTWNMLRTTEGKSIEEAREVMAWMVGAALRNAGLEL